MTKGTIKMTGNASFKVDGRELTEEEVAERFDLNVAEEPSEHAALAKLSDDEHSLTVAMRYSEALQGLDDDAS